MSPYNALVGILGMRGEIIFLLGRMTSVIGVRVKGEGAFTGMIEGPSWVELGENWG